MTAGQGRSVTSSVTAFGAGGKVCPGGGDGGQRGQKVVAAGQRVSRDGHLVYASGHSVGLGGHFVWKVGQ